MKNMQNYALLKNARYLLGVFLKNSDKHPRSFIPRVPPPGGKVSGTEQAPLSGSIYMLLSSLGMQFFPCASNIDSSLNTDMYHLFTESSFLSVCNIFIQSCKKVPLNTCKTQQRGDIGFKSISSIFKYHLIQMYATGGRLPLFCHQTSWS